MSRHTTGSRERGVCDRLDLLVDREGTEEEHRRFCLLFARSLGAMLAGLALLNYLVNPFHVWAPELVRAFHADTRAQKLELMRKARAADAVIVGSSMVLKLSPDLLAREAGLKTFNAGVCYGLPEDCLAMLRAGVEHCGLKPRVVLVGVDMHAFDRCNAVMPGFEQSPVLARYLVPGKNTAGWQLPQRLWGKTITRESLRALWYSAFPPAQGPRFEPDGYQTPWELFVTPPGDREQRIAQEFPHWLRYYESDPGVEPAHRRAFEEMVDYAQARGARVLVFHTPLYGRLEEVLRDTTWPAAKRATLGYLREACARRRVTFLDLSAPATYGGDPDDFEDAMHIGATSGMQLTHYLAERLREPAPGRTQTD